MRPRSLLWAGGLVALGTAAGFLAFVRAPQSPTRSARTSPPVSTIAPATEAAAVTPSMKTATAESATPVKSASRAARVSRVAEKLPSSNAVVGSAGMIVGLDPETGELGMPTAEQLQELRAMDDPKNWSDEGLEVVLRPDGSRSIETGDRFPDYTVARIGADGKLHYDCVQGSTEAKKLMDKPLGSTVDPNIDPKSGLEVR